MIYRFSVFPSYKLGLDKFLNFSWPCAPKPPSPCRALGVFAFEHQLPIDSKQAVQITSGRILSYQHLIHIITCIVSIGVAGNF